MKSGQGTPPNVLLVVLDTVRAKSSYLADQPHTPTLERFAERGLDFQRAIAPAPWSLPSHASMFTGTYPSEHGATNYNMKLPDGYATIARQLSDQGYETGLFTTNAFLTDIYNMDDGFDTVYFSQSTDGKRFEDGIDIVRFNYENDFDSQTERFLTLFSEMRRGPLLPNVGNFMHYLSNAIGRRLPFVDPGFAPEWDELALREAERFVRATRETEIPFFATINVVQAHGPWPYSPRRLENIGVDPAAVAEEDRWKEIAEKSESQFKFASGELTFDENEREMLEALYESWVRSVDDTVGGFLDSLEAAGGLEDTVVILTSDHGEQIARDGVLGHEISIGEDVSWVPLVVAGSGIPDRSVSSVVNLKDLYGTILALAGLDADNHNLVAGEGYGQALIEMTGLSPSQVPDEYASVADDIGMRRALYTDEGSVERRYERDEVIGDRSLISELDAIVDSFDDDKIAELVTEQNEMVENRLRDLGYIN